MKKLKTLKAIEKEVLSTIKKSGVEGVTHIPFDGLANMEALSTGTCSYRLVVGFTWKESEQGTMFWKGVLKEVEEYESIKNLTK